MKKSIKILLAATATLSLGAAGIALVCPTDGDGCGSHGPAAQAKTAATSKASALPAMFRSKANGDDCGMGRGDNCNDGCEQGVKTGTKTVNASLVSGKAMCESHGQFGNHDIAGAKRTIKMTSRGVSIEIASDDPTLVAAFHARFGKMQNASPMSLGSKANGNDCGMDCDDNCDDGCEHGAEIGTKTANASLASLPNKASGDDCGMGSDDNCDDGCEHGAETGTKTVNASLASLPNKASGDDCGMDCDDNCDDGCEHGAEIGTKTANASLASLPNKASGDDCGMDCDDNCDDGCEHGAEIGTKTVNASLASGKTMREGHGRHGNYGIEGAKRTIKMTPRGIIIEITSDDPTVIAAIQARFSKKQVTTEIASTKP